MTGKNHPQILHPTHSIKHKMALKTILACILLASAALGCRPLWDNKCTSSSDCCSRNCWKSNANWAMGVCKPGSGGNGNNNPSHHGGNGNKNPSHHGGGKLVSQDEFNKAVTSSGYPHPRHDQYSGFINGLPKGQINNKREAAMFLAQLLWESGGLIYKEEIRCKHNQCAGEYTNAGCEVPGKYYYGRGYIQLTWCYNYKAASAGLGLGDQLLRNPENVAKNEQLSWDTASWFWNVNVRNGRYGAQVRDGQFGASTNAINGGLECRGQNGDKARKRFTIYQRVFTAFRVDGRPNERGCY